MKLRRAITAAHELPAVAAEASPSAPFLPMDQASQMTRANDMGFDTSKSYFVSALQPLDAFESHGKFMGHKGISGTSVSDKPELASRYLDRYGDNNYKGEPFNKNMMEVYIRPGNAEEFSKPIFSGIPMGAPLPKNYQWPSGMNGIDTAVFPDRITKRGDVAHLPEDTQRPFIRGTETILRDPSQVRSVNAEFNPAKASSRNLLDARGAPSPFSPFQRMDDDEVPQ